MEEFSTVTDSTKAFLGLEHEDRNYSARRKTQY